MNLSVPCECGESVTVTEGDAGGRLTCRCGRIIIVPSLRELRRQAGVPAKVPSPELVLEALLLAGRLPDEQDCVLCGDVTSGCVTCFVEIEKARVSDGRQPWWVKVWAFLQFGWLGAMLIYLTRKPSSETGKDRYFRVPLRICDNCRPRLADAHSIKRALRSVPLYRKLLDRYPRALVSLCANIN